VTGEEGRRRGQLRLDHAIRGDRGGDDGGLRDLGPLQLVLGALCDQLRQGSTKGLVGLLEHLTRERVLAHEIGGHADRLRALAREYDG
jgi:hypothetical protein